MGGAAAFAASIGRQLFWIAADSIPGRARPIVGGVPRSVEAMNAPWLGEALGAVAAGSDVIRVERLGGHSGTTTRERLRLTWDGAPASGPQPGTVFVKLTPNALGSRLFTSMLELGASEVDFYRAFGGSFPVRIPQVFCARREGRGGRFVLVLEDLEASGCRFHRASDPLGVEEARAVMKTLARLHGSFWQSPRFGEDLAWLRSPENNPRESLEWWLCARSNGPALSRYGDLLPEGVRRNAHRVHEARPLLEAHWARAPRTLIHGDSHAGNLFFDGDEAGWFDWQVAQVGPGLRDVAYFLVNSLDTDVRRAHERELLSAYLQALGEHGVVGCDFAPMWEQYRLFALYTWIAVSVTAAAATLQSREVVRRAMVRTGAALADLDSFAALDALVALDGGRSPDPAAVGSP